ncbi:MAG: ribosome maturation factor RimP, partial [Okeania sp. SIO2H7]|nr:ribosome maturation factor RimP [Okeania sp. SIO2H7]
VADNLGLDVVNAVFHTNQNPPVLRIDIRSRSGDTGLQDCEAMSQSLDLMLDETELIPDAYVLEISSPGVSKILSSDRDFISFKGFPVTVETTEPHKGETHWQGNLLRRDASAVFLSLKGRTVKIPNEMIKTVQLDD